MLVFDLPLVSGAISVAQALAEMHEANCSGLVLKKSEGRYDVLGFDSLAEAATNDVELVSDIDAVTVVDVAHLAETKYSDYIRSRDTVFGLLETFQYTARLFSISEQFAMPLIGQSSSRRCSRPNKPANMHPRNWYHYYPPQKVPQPPICTVCLYPIP